MNIGSVLTRAARRTPDHPALIQGGRRLSYADFNARANRFASGLRALGVDRGDRVAILQSNRPELLETLFGVFKAGAVAVPVNARLQAGEYRYIVDHSEARAVVFSPEFAEGVARIRGELPHLDLAVCAGGEAADALAYEEVLARGSDADADADVGDDELAWFFYTSGTTGRPKGAMVSHGNLRFMNDHYFTEVYPLAPEDVVLHAGPLTHGSGLWAIPITAGSATQVIAPPGHFDAEGIFRIIESQRVTKIAFIAPTMITILLNAPGTEKYDVSSLRFIGYGGSPMYVEDLKRAVERFGPVLCQIYGQGECPMTISMLARDDHVLSDDPAAQRRLASAGRPRGDIEVAVLDDADQPVPEGGTGEVCLRGAVVMKGYWKDSEATEKAFAHGWYHTGDIGKFDEGGYLYLLDRKKELIISGGANIYPREVEEVLLMHPGVLEAAVIGIPDRLWGESVLALIRPRAGAQPKEEELLALCREHLAGYKKPRSFRFVDDLPKNAYGKILKRELRAQYAQAGGEARP